MKSDASAAGGSPSAAAVDRVIDGLAAAGVVRVTNGETPEADQVALRSAALLDADPASPSYWRTLQECLHERSTFRHDAEEWYRQAAQDYQDVLGRHRRWFVSGLVNLLTWVGGHLQRWGAWLRRVLRLPRLARANLLAGDRLDDVRTYHDRNDTERRFVEVSRFHELEDQKRNRVLVAVFAGLTAFAVVGWAAALRYAHQERAQRYKTQVQRDALDMQMTAEATSNHGISVLLMTENPQAAHVAKKILIIQTLGHALFSDTPAARNQGVEFWQHLQKQLSGGPAGPFFDDLCRDYSDVIGQIVATKPVSRETVNGLRAVSMFLRQYIRRQKEANEALEEIKPVILRQFARAADQIAAAAADQTPEGVGPICNVYWRLYTGGLVLLEEWNDPGRTETPKDIQEIAAAQPAGPLGQAARQFAEALWKWEKESRDGKASAAVLQELKDAAVKVKDVSK
jgi:hypothetical protein